MKIGIPLESIHMRKAPVHFEPSLSDLAKLQAILEPEYELYEKLRQIYYSAGNGS